MPGADGLLLAVDAQPVEARADAHAAAVRKVYLLPVSIGGWLLAAGAFSSGFSASSHARPHHMAKLMSFTAGQMSQQMHRSSIRSASTDAWVEHLPTFGGLGRLPPSMYGRVGEKTIWSYWYDAEACPSSKRCALPADVELCFAGIRRNRGEFDHRLLHMDEVALYVSDLELPRMWGYLRRELQTRSLMNALLARYGGVAIDSHACLKQPIDAYWRDMLTAGATSSRYRGRCSSLERTEPGSAIFTVLMSRREGIFRTVASLQAATERLAAADLRDLPHSTFSDDLLSLAVHMFDCFLPTFSADSAAAGCQSCLECSSQGCTTLLSATIRNVLRMRRMGKQPMTPRLVG
mmetsp:Transcript_58750/g.182498  ORF Transcript_58750/g.182498 Transcript_58750/m.182498 type:complete len:349 (+) Transcript_58750:40-1086(+)